MQFRHEGSEKRYTFCGIKNKLNFSEVLEKNWPCNSSKIIIS